MKQNHKFYMRQALAQAEECVKHSEIPIGAVIILNDEIIGIGRNRMGELKNPLVHAEMEALNQARQNHPDKWLSLATLYCTIEPCPMCAGAAILCRIERIVFGAYEPRWGACGTIYNLPESSTFNHHIEVIGGIMEKECKGLLQKFFHQKRKK